MRIPIIIASATLTGASATTSTNGFEFVLADQLGDELQFRARDSEGRERNIDVRFTSDRIRVPHEQSLGIVDINNNFVPLSRFQRMRSSDPSWRFSDDEYLVFPIGIDSDLSIQYDSIYLGPRHNRHVLITSPFDVESLCVGGNVHFVRTLSQSTMLPVQISVDYEQMVSTIPLWLSLTSNRYSRVPEEIFDSIQDAVNRVGCSRAARAQLPSIWFNFTNIEIEMLPEDYVEETVGRCEIKLEICNWPTLGTNILKNLGIIIDYRENRIGICDPS